MYLHHAGNNPFLHDPDSVPQTAGKSVHGSDVGNKQVLQVCGLSTHLGVKVQTSRLQATLLNNSLRQTYEICL